MKLFQYYIGCKGISMLYQYYGITVSLNNVAALLYCINIPLQEFKQQFLGFFEIPTSIHEQARSKKALMQTVPGLLRFLMSKLAYLLGMHLTWQSDIIDLSIPWGT